MMTQTSAAATTSPAAIAVSTSTATLDCATLTTWSSGRNPEPRSFGMTPWMTVSSTRPTTRVLSSAFAPSQSAWVPKMRLMPARMSKCLNENENALKCRPP